MRAAVPFGFSLPSLVKSLDTFHVLVVVLLENQVRAMSEDSESVFGLMVLRGV